MQQLGFQRSSDEDTSRTDAWRATLPPDPIIEVDMVVSTRNGEVRLKDEPFVDIGNRTRDT